jgi:hypothetical protein
MTPILGIIASGNYAGANASSYESIATANGTGSSTAITFSSIPSTYAHLQIRGVGKTASSSSTFDRLRMTFNSDSAANYSLHEFYTVNGTVYSTATANASAMYGFNVAFSGTGYTSICGAGVIDILNYANTNMYKTIRGFGGIDVNSTSYDEGINFTGGNWRNTNAITSITLTSPSGNWTTATSFALYGVKS